MKYARIIAVTAMMIMGFAAIAPAQMGMMGMRPPTIPGEFKPVVGSGAQYAVTPKDGDKMELAIAIVGKESVDGQDGYWMETRMLSGRGAGMISKNLLVMSGDNPGVKRMIIQMPPRPPMEMPVGMMGHRPNMPPHEAAGSGANHGMGEVVGTESVTVPAGTFECQHYRSTSDNGTSDFWVATKVSPYGLVKMTSGKENMVLEKVLTNETSQITGEPQKMNFPGMPQ